MFDIKDAEKTLQSFQALLDKTPPDAAHVRLGPEAWTLTEIVGHLVDSASNNHQRFARLRFGDLEHFPAYGAEPWVQAQEYDKCNFAMLSTLWSSYNALLSHLVATMPEKARGNVWINQGEPLTLEFLAEDYYRHLRIHIEHYEGRLSEVLEHLRAKG